MSNTSQKVQFKLSNKTLGMLQNSNALRFVSHTQKKEFQIKGFKY